MTLKYTELTDYKVSEPDIEIILSKLEKIESELNSTQKAIALVLNRLPHIVHNELVNHECKCKGFEY